ncbi:LYR motif-containing protein 2 [Gadus morhua]|uniref:LYR motif-containing protein 2 n=1 Tax=Gadus morhua TaxID=8049 RepID=A0A8C5AC95_GADMO|nr:LYR motif-containing protein 2 [Gadus morhua]
MSGSRLPAVTLTLKQFLQRQRVLGLYRSLLRTIREVPDPADRSYLRSWARDEFQRNKTATNPDAIRMMVMQASDHLGELQTSLALARS